jgi:glyoxylase-like metal-dependent hydrolase (beta-lactamase superfamily II)
MERHTNAYVIEGSKGAILVDCGWDSSEAVWAFREELRLDRLSFDDIEWIVVTHIHPDHFALASKLKELCNAKVIMHRAEAQLIESRYVKYTRLSREMQAMLVAEGTPADEAAGMCEASMWELQFVTPVHPDILVEEGDTISNGTFQFDVIHTPGHTAGHICLYEPRKRRLFCGDHVLFDVVPRACIDPQSTADPVSDYLESLERVSAQNVSFVFPGHGPVFNSLVIRSDEIRRHMDLRQKQIAGVLDDGLKTGYHVACSLSWRTEDGMQEFADLSARDRRVAVFEAVAWLRRLVNLNQVGIVEREGKRFYLAK